MFMKQEENNALEDCISTGRRLIGSEKITDLEPHVLDQVPTSSNIYSAAPSSAA